MYILPSDLTPSVLKSFFKEPGSHLLSHAVSSIVPSAVQVLTIVFGMGTGVSPGRIATRKVSVIQKLIASASRAISNRFALLDVGIRPMSSVMAGLLSCKHAHPFHVAVRTAH